MYSLLPDMSLLLYDCDAVDTDYVSDVLIMAHWPEVLYIIML